MNKGNADWASRQDWYLKTLVTGNEYTIIVRNQYDNDISMFNDFDTLVCWDQYGRENEAIAAK